jgi:hypothetical protein
MNSAKGHPYFLLLASTGLTAHRVNISCVGLPWNSK